MALPLSLSVFVILVSVFLYALLVAAFLPLPTELVLGAPLLLELPPSVSYPLVIVVAGAGKAAGSLIVVRIGYGVRNSGPVIRLGEYLPRYRRFKRETVTGFVRRYRYLGLLVALSTPLLPETATMYAFGVIETRPVLFAMVAFLGTIIRLSIALLLLLGLVTVTI